MGNKTNPTSMRVGVNQNWKSVWYSSKSDYAKMMHEDLMINEIIRKKLKPAGVDEIRIKRSMNKVLIEITVARPGVVIGRGGAGIEDLKKELKKKIKGDVEPKILEVKKNDVSANLIAENIGNQLERRIVPKYAAEREVENARSASGVKGVKIWISGRIKGAEIARTEKFQWGRIPLQTLRADIDYSYKSVQVPNAGKQGIKVWVYKGDKNEIEYDE
ncbi:30S ribosomal protein S3 [Candidatus Dojkabacteria bacterium]|nr:30S ribosomal protein S3 [Candidatus Dojkabacteria bacterium]